MAAITRVNKGSINWTGSGSTSWNTIDTASGASATTVSSSYSVTTSMAYSTAFTLTTSNVITGILLYCCQDTAAGAKTLSVKFSHDGGTTNDSTVTINCSALPANGNPGWVLFNLSAPYTSTGSANNVVGLQASGVTGALVYGYSTTSTAIGHILVTSTGSVDTPLTTDPTYIVTDIVAGTPLTVTMNNTNSTTFGNCQIGSNATLNFPNGGSYTLYLNGRLYIWGSLVMGTSGTPITQGNLANITFSSGQGFTTYNGGIITTYGAAKTQFVQLAADYSSGTSATLSTTPTNWNNGETLAFSSTSTTGGTQNEIKTLGANVTSTTATLSSPLTYAHIGSSTAALRCYVSNLTRNVQILGSSGADQTNIIAAGAVVNFQYTEFTYMQYNGFAINTNTANSGSFIMQNCSLHTGNSGAYLFTFSNVGNPGPTVTIQYNNLFISGAGMTQSAPWQQQNLTVDTNVWMITDTSHSWFSFASWPQTYSATIGYGAFTNNIVVGGGGIMCTFCEPFGHFDNNVCLCYSYFMNFNSQQRWPGTFNANIFGYPISGSCVFNPGTSIAMYFYITNCYFYGNNTYNVIDVLNATGEFVNCYFANTAYSESSSGYSGASIKFINCIFANGVFFTNGGASRGRYFEVLDCAITGTFLADQSYLSYNDAIIVQNYNQTAGDNRLYTLYGTVQSDKIIYNSPQTQSQRCIPQNAATGTANVNLPTLGAYLESQHYHVMVNSGGTCTASVNYRRSASGDSGGANYNGAQPQLIVKRNVSCGINADTVIATATGSSYGSWISLSGTLAGAGITTTCDAVVDFAVLSSYGSNAGWINISDWSATS